MAKSKTSATIQIQAPVEEVFKFAATPKHTPMFVPNLAENSGFSTDETAVGQTWDWRFTMLGVDLTGKAETTAVEPNKSWSLKSSGGAASEWTYTYEAAGGGTQVTVTCEYEIPAGVLKKAAAPAVEAMNAKLAVAALDNLKTILED